MKVLKYTLAGLLILLLTVIGYVFAIQAMFDVNQLPEHYGQVNAKLFTTDGEKRPLIVYFGGSEGGNSLTKAHNTSERQFYIDAGYAILAVGYFGMPGIPAELDRISLNGIYQAIQHAQQDPNIDASCTALIGGSKGAELALLLASRYPQINAVISLAGSHVSFNSTSIAADGRTASYYFDHQPVPFIQLPKKAIVPMLLGDFRRAHELALEDKEQVASAIIEVEKINGPILLVSGEKDHVWPSAEMSTKVVNRLQSKHFAFPFQHLIVPNGNHFQPQNDYHPQVLAFLNQHFRPQCTGKT